MSANTAANNTAVGHNALKSNTTGTQLVAVGLGALDANTTANDNTAVGYDALGANTTGYQCTAVGKDALLAATGAVNCTAIGKGALAACNAQDNTALGEAAGYSVTTGTDNVFIGKATHGPTTASNSVVIGSDIGDQGNNSNMVAIGNGSVAASFSGAASSWTFASDGRDKTDIVDLPLGLDFVKKLKPRKFRWDYRDKKRFPVDSAKNPDMLIRSGFIAQEIQEVLKEENAHYTKIVNDDKPDQLTVGSSDIIPMLVNAVKELSSENNALKARLDAAGL